MQAYNAKALGVYAGTIQPTVQRVSHKPNPRDYIAYPQLGKHALTTSQGSQALLAKS